MFKEELTEKALLKHKDQDYKIKLIEEKKPIKKGIYYLLEKKLKVLRKYI